MSITLEIPQEVETRLENMTPGEREHLLTQALVGHFAIERILERRRDSASRVDRARARSHEMKEQGVSRSEAFDSLRDLLDRINS